ncbi:MAG TPA: hypothetical protein VGZ69_06405 [Candidatus Rhabdochlamydia sp.]|jgi:hypothetical protein|nr:hypothetical protein [Candidatus Rhabdochlamydia sp.]
MAIPVDPPSILEPIYQNVNSPPVKLTLCKKISKIFFSLFEKISNLFSRKPSQMKKEIEAIYDTPKNNRPVKTLTLYERVSNFFARGPSQIKLLEEKFNREIAQLQQKNEKLCHYIYVNAVCIHALKDMVYAKEAQIYSLEETISALEVDLYRPTQTSRSDSGFSESPPPIREKTKSFLSKASQFLKNK